MPSIEILATNIRKFKCVEEISFAIDVSHPPQSHRDPSRWQDFFSNTGGTLVHLGDPEMKDQKSGWFNCYELLDISDEDIFFGFKVEYQVEIEMLLQKLLMASNGKPIYFTSDYQFGPVKSFKYENVLSRYDFDKLHRAKKLRFNCLYTIL